MFHINLLIFTKEYLTINQFIISFFPSRFTYVYKVQEFIIIINYFNIKRQKIIKFNMVLQKNLYLKNLASKKNILRKNSARIFFVIIKITKQF